MADRAVKNLDAYQRNHRWLGFPIAVIYKFTDDQGGYLSALITYYGFLSLFPLLLLLITVLGVLLNGDPHLQARLLNSTLSQFPVVRDQLRMNVHSRSGTGAGLAVGGLVALYGALGAAQATQNAFNRAWAVPRNRRPNPFRSRLRSLLLLAVLGLGIIATTTLSGLTTAAGTYGATVGAGLRGGALVLAALINIGVFLLAFRVLTSRDVPTRQLRLGAILAGIGWQVTQMLGTFFLTHLLKGAGQVYGVFGLVLGLIAWIYLLAVVTVLAAETCVVAQRRLWPRALLTPFTDEVQLTPGDRRAYRGYAQAERHKGFQVVDVGFERQDPVDGEGG